MGKRHKPAPTAPGRAQHKERDIIMKDLWGKILPYICITAAMADVGLGRDRRQMPSHKKKKDRAKIRKKKIVRMSRRKNR